MNRVLMEYLTKQGIVQEPGDGMGDSASSLAQPFGVSDDDLLLGSTLPRIPEVRQPRQAQVLQQVYFECVLNVLLMSV
jgi:hypothetical protein